MLPAAVVFLWSALAGQALVTIHVDIRAGDQPVVGARVTVGGTTYVTDAGGTVAAAVRPGPVRIDVTHDGYLTVTTDLAASASGQRVSIALEPAPTHEEEITVSATRSGRRLDDQPMRVEVLEREEIEEKMLMTPGDIVMMLNEMGGMRVQATSPSLGAASVRMQGMRGRYTRFLSDGLPLFGGQPGGLGLLQIPPMDLGQVEVIKGVASALYGAGAMGGVINLVSRRPGEAPEHELLLNVTSRGGADAVLWLSGPLNERWGATLLGGGHWQTQQDVNDDAWADLPGYSRGVVRPRVFWTGEGGRSFFATAGATWEARDGGTTGDRGLPATGLPYREALDTARLDVGAAGQTVLGGRFVLTARAAAARQRHDHQFGPDLERDRHDTAFGEVAVRGASGRHTWVAGAAVEHDAYTPEDLPAFGYSFTVPGLFLQDDIDIAPWLSVSASARLDAHSEYGSFFSPRLSGLVRSGEWTARASAGTGFYGPTPLTEETEAAGLTRLSIPRPLRPERGRSASLDITRAAGPVSSTLTLFGSRVSDPVRVTRDTDYTLANRSEPTTNVGVEMLGILRHAPFALTASYTYVRAREAGGDVALTPRHAAGMVGMIEDEEAGRIGLEIYYTGRQQLEANPFRVESLPFVIVGLLAEKRLGRWRVFVNGENLTGVRQTKWDPLLRPSQAADGRWAVDVWAPLDGRTINGGIRMSF